MKALVYTGPNALDFRDEADPVPADGEVLVRVEAVGICGSDMHAYHGLDSRRPAPLILGHEAAGRIASGPNAGRRVAVNPLVTCGSCEFCVGGRAHLCRSRQIISMPPRPGAFAEYLRIPEENLAAIPDGLGTVQAAIAEPVAVAYHAVNLVARLTARPITAARCVVLGGGAIGLAAALVLAMLGAGEIRIAETNPARRRTCGEAGPFRCYEPGAPGEPEESTVDLVVDAVGAVGTRAAASRMVKPGGVIVHVGLLPGTEGLDIRKVTLQEILFTGTYCYTPLDFIETLQALASGRLGDLRWLEERPLASGGEAFADLDAGRTSAAKIILRP